MLSRLSLLLLLCFVFCDGEGTFSKRQVKAFPGENGVPPSKTYSGFVSVDEDDTSLFYILAESQNDPSSDPVILYMNGGPGASSLSAFFGANGPMLYVAENEFMINPYAWNRNASLLAIEFAPGIGFSYCSNSTKENGTSFCPREERMKGTCSPCFASDSSVATQNAVALETLFGEVFPEFKSRALYVSGESYAGTYVPTLAREILSKPLKYPSVQNVKGFWVTDPCMSNEMQFGYLDLGVTFAMEKGLISSETYETLTQSCTKSRTPVGDRVRDTSTRECRVAWRLYDVATNGIGNAVHPAPIKGLPMYIDPLNAFGPSEYDGPDVQRYLDSLNVRKVLGVEHSMPYFMEIGNNGYDQYTIEYSACNDLADASSKRLPSMIDVWREVIDLVSKQKDRHTEIMLLNGDLDGIVALKGTECSARAIGHDVVSELRRLWFYNASATPEHVLMKKTISWGPTLRGRDAGAQIGGFVLRVNTTSNVRLRFVTIRDAGHMTPAYAPMKTLHTLHALLEQKRLAPIFSENFFDASDGEFYEAGIFANWVKDAMLL